MSRKFSQMYRSGIRKAERRIRVYAMTREELLALGQRTKNNAMIWAVKRSIENHRLAHEAKEQNLMHVYRAYVLEENWWRLAAIRAHLGVS